MAFTERHIEDLDELFQVLRLSNVIEFGDQTISPWVFRGQPDADFPLVPKLWRDGFLDNPAFSAREGLLFRMVDDALSNLGPSRWSEQPERARSAAKRLIIEHVLMKNFYSLASDVVGLNRVQIASISELLRLHCTSLFRFTDSYWRAMPLAQHYGIPSVSSTGLSTRSRPYTSRSLMKSMRPSGLPCGASTRKHYSAKTCN